VHFTVTARPGEHQNPACKGGAGTADNAVIGASSCSGPRLASWVLIGSTGNPIHGGLSPPYMWLCRADESFIQCGTGY